MHKFIFPCWGRRRKAAEQIHHSACDKRADPNVAVYDPHNIPLSFTVRPAHVPNLRIWSQIVSPAISAREVGILFFYQYLDIEAMVVYRKSLKDRDSRVIPRRDAEIDRQLLLRVRLVEGRGKTFVEVGLDALDGANDGDMWDMLQGQGVRNRWCRYPQVIPSSAPPSAAILVG